MKKTYIHRKINIERKSSSFSLRCTTNNLKGSVTKQGYSYCCPNLLSPVHRLKVTFGGENDCYMRSYDFKGQVYTNIWQYPSLNTTCITVIYSFNY